MSQRTEKLIIAAEASKAKLSPTSTLEEQFNSASTALEAVGSAYTDFMIDGYNQLSGDPKSLQIHLRSINQGLMYAPGDTELLRMKRALEAHLSEC